MDNFDDKYKKKNPFSVPEDYFDRLTDRVMGNINSGEKKLPEIKIPPKTRYFEIVKPYLGLVGIFLLALFIVQAFFPLVIDEKQMIKHDEKGQIVQKQETEQEEIIFDSQFNPTREEIIEYLTSEANTDELFYADLFY